MVATLTIRSYRSSDRPGVRAIFGQEEFARPCLLRQYPGLSDYLADRMEHYLTHEPQSAFVAELQGRIIGAVLGTTDTIRMHRLYSLQVIPRVMRRSLSGEYGWPAWLIADWRTEIASQQAASPYLNLMQYPAHFHVGLHPEWRRQGIGTALVTRFCKYLTDIGSAGLHVRVPSYQPDALSFVSRLGLEPLGAYDWHYSVGNQKITITERIYGLLFQLVPNSEPAATSASRRLLAAMRTPRPKALDTE